MPVVSINLNDKAFEIYNKWKETRKGSARVSRAILLDHQKISRLDVGPGCDCVIVRFGDRRKMCDGNWYQLGAEGWERSDETG